MKKPLIALIILFLTIIFSIYAVYLKKNNEARNLTQYNMVYEYYLNKTIKGNELATLINKAVDLNEKNKIEKDKKDHYIENEFNSLKIEVMLASTEKTYSMEEFYNNNTSMFVKFFNDENFKCTSIEYHEKTGKIKNMYFKQV